MKSVFLNEFRQNYLLVWLGFLLSALIAILYWAWSHSYVETLRDQRDLDGFCGFLLLAISGVIILGASAGLFSSEAARGTLPFLLALPLGRTRIWLAKALAGLALAASAALLMILLDAWAIPGVVREVPFWLLLPDIIMWGLLIFSVALFYSTLLQRTLSVLLASLGSLLALAIALLIVVEVFGARLLGYDDLLDLALWALLLAASLLFASWATFTRGELLSSRRKWALAFPSFLLGLALLSPLVVGAVRHALRYQRAAVRAVQDVSLPPGGSVAVFTALGSPLPVERKVGRGWAKPESSSYRSQHTVFLDLKTGRELLVHRGSEDAVVSPDGRYAAVLPPRFTITWAEFPGQSQDAVEIWDLRQHRRLHRVTPARLGSRLTTFGDGIPEWSPDSHWLAVRTYTVERGEQGFQVGREGLLLMRPDGSDHLEIVTGESRGAPPPGAPPPSDVVISWGWDPAGEALYALELGGRLARHHLPGGEAKPIWQLPVPGTPLPSGYRWFFHRLLVSPSGRWIAVTGSAAPPRPGQEPRKRVSVTMVIAADGSRVHRIADGAYHYLAWSGDGRSLYLIQPRSNSWVVEMLRWQEGEERALPVPGVTHARPADWHRAVRQPGLLVWMARQSYFVDERGTLRNLPAGFDRLASSQFRGLDAQGRAILLKPDGLVAVEPTTGRLTRIYP